MGLRVDVVRQDVLALQKVWGGEVPMSERGTRRPALVLVAIFFVVLLSPFVFDLATPALAR